MIAVPGVVFDQIVGGVLTKYRNRCDLNQRQATDGTSLNVSSLSRIERGDYSLNMQQLFELSNRYSVSMAEMASSIEASYHHAIQQGMKVEQEKKSNTSLLLLGAAAVAALVVLSKGRAK